MRRRRRLGEILLRIRASARPISAVSRGASATAFAHAGESGRSAQRTVDAGLLFSQGRAKCDSVWRPAGSAATTTSHQKSSDAPAVAVDVP